MREAFYERIAKKDMAPLWKVMKSVVTKEPVTRAAPHVWHYDDVKSLVMESGGLITAEEAERRVLILENPALHGESEGHQYAVRRRPDDHAGRSRAGAPPRLLRHPLRARRRGRLYRGRGREGLHVARRFRHHRELGAARSRQSIEQADAVARRARFPGGQFLRGLLRRAFRRCRRRRPRAQDGDSLSLLRLGRAARRHDGDEPHAR